VIGPSSCYAGIDVGAQRKNFHVAVVSRSALAGVNRIETADGVVDWLSAFAPTVVAVDSPRGPAPPGALSREDERRLVRARVCGIRFTPDLAIMRAHGGGYYDWVLNGFALYDRLDSADAGWEVIECFPTAAFMRLGGPRAGASRADWTRSVLARLPIEGLPSRMSQDERDAVMAALTASAYDEGSAERFGEIVVPRAATAK
jgi:predicted nuclease with RNAse H fold